MRTGLVVLQGLLACGGDPVPPIAGDTDGATTVAEAETRMPPGEASDASRGEEDEAGSSSSGEPVCPPRVVEGDVDVTDRAGLDALDGVTEVTGYLVVGGFAAESLGALSCLESVGGALMVSNLDKGPHDLADLGRLRHADSIHVDSVPTLRTIAPLDGEFEALSLTALGGLETLDGIASTRARHVSLSSLPRIDSLEPLAPLAGDLRSLTLYLDALTSLEGLDGVVELDSLTISAPIEDASALAGLESVSGFVWLTRWGVPELASLASLQSVGALIVGDNEQLVDASALDGVEVGALLLDDLPLLTTLPAVTIVDDPFVGADDYSIGLSNLPMLQDLSGLDLSSDTLRGAVALERLPQLGAVDELGGLAHIGGGGPGNSGLTLAELSLDAAALAPLSTVQSIGGGLNVRGLPVADLSFLAGLQNVDGNLRLSYNDFIDVADLHDVKFTGYTAEITNNELLYEACVEELRTALESNGFLATWDVSDNGSNSLPCGG